MGLVSELKRRNVFRMAALYVVAAWLVMQVAEVLIGLANLPEWIGPTILALLAIGFPIALVLSWFYELTPAGISREDDIEAAEIMVRASGRRVDFIVIALLAAGLLLFAWDKWWVGPPPERSIAVLAFENMSADPEQEYFSDGISEEILNLLAQLPDLKVISRSSAFAFKGKDIAIPAIAEQLNVAHVLEGSVRRDGDRVRITAQLIEARSDAHLWSRTYDRTLDDIFAIQDDISAAIVDALKVRLGFSAGETPHAISAANAGAYDAYLQGRNLINKRGRKNTAAAIGHLERALRLDANFAPAHAQLAIALILYIGYTPEERLTAIAHLDRALELEPDLAEAHAGRALLAYHDRDFEPSVTHARKALVVNPNYVDAMRWLAISLEMLGQEEEANAIRDQVLVIDPMSVVGRVSYALRLSSKGRYEEAHAIGDQLIAEGNLWAGYQLHVESYLWQEGKLAETLYWALKGGADFEFNAMAAFQFVGMHDEARRFDNPYSSWSDVEERNWDAAIDTALNRLQLEPDTPYLIGDAAEVLFLAGRLDEALPLYERLADLAAEDQLLPIPWFPLGQTIRLAVARRMAGDEEGAQAAARTAMRELHIAEQCGDEESSFLHHLAEAMFAAFENNPDRALAELQSTIRNGLRTVSYIDDPSFADLRNDPRFVAARQELLAILATERERILQLVCFNNPVPDEWQPLPETCEDVTEQGS